MSMNELMNALKAFRIVRVDINRVSDFVEFCHANEVYPCGGAFEEHHQWLYI